MASAMEMDDSQRAAVAQNEPRLLGLYWGSYQLGLDPPAGEVQGRLEGAGRTIATGRGDNASWNAPKWRKQSSKGTGRNAEGWGKRKNPEEEEQGVLDKQTQVLLQMMTRMTLRHDQELCRLRVDTSFVMFSDVGDHGCLPRLRATAENWSDQFAQGKVTCSLKVIMMLSLLKMLREELEKTQTDDTLAEKYRALSWMVEGDNALSPCWTYLEWNSAEKKEQVSKQQPLKHQEVLTILDKMDLAIPLQGVLTNFRNTKGMDTAAAPQAPGSAHHPRQDGLGHSSAGSADKLSQHQGHGHRQGDPVHDQHRPAPLLDRGRTPGPAKTIWMLLHEAHRKPSPPGSGQRPQLAKQMEEAFMATDFCDWAPRRTQ
eukprot:s1437_g12.t1